MNLCNHCRKQIGRLEAWERIDAGARMSDGTRIGHDVNLHTGCLGPWFVVHYPWLVTERPHQAA